MSPTRRQTQIDTIPMFDEPEHVGKRRSESARTKPKPDAQAYCPCCHRIVKTTGRRLYTNLLRQGDHLVWAVHDITTTWGSKMPCRASGIPYCQQPAKVEPYAVCACQ